jgi:cytochrome c biogenesis protein CcmG/thiol:disulfide interchange protein DsbE
MSNRLTRCLLGIAVAGMALGPMAHGPEALAKSAPTRVAAPHFTLTTSTGRLDSDSLRGRVVLVDFWASWCGPCRQSFPWMATMHDRYAAKGLVIVAVNLDKDRALADKFLDGFHVPFTVVFDPSGKTADAFHVKAMPTSFLVDRSGEIRMTHAGFDAKKTDAMEAALEEACSK